MIQDEKQRSIKLIILRILISPLVCLWGIFIMAMGSLFWFPFLMMVSIVGIIAELSGFILRLGGSNIQKMEPLITTKYNCAMLSHLLGLTIYIWYLPASTIAYILYGEIWFLDLDEPTSATTIVYDSNQ